MIGGFLPGDDGLTSGVSDRVYALNGDKWEQLPPLNHARAAAAAAVVDGKIVVVGGQADGKLVPETEVFDGAEWTEAAPIPTPREHLGAASDGRYLYAVGGRELSASKNLDSFERYDPAADTWTELDPMPKAGRQRRRVVRGRTASSRSAARARRPSPTRCRPTTSRRVAGRSSRRSPRAATASP